MDDDTLAESLTGMAGPTSRDPGRRCKVGLILATVSPTNRATILDLLDERHADGRYLVGADDLASRLTRGGHTVGMSTIGRHRLGRCNCPQATA